MTRGEIIEQLESIIGAYEILMGHGVNSDILGAVDIEAIREAIEELKVEPCEDCIDRETLMSIEYEDVITIKGRQYVSLLEVAEKTIKLPTVRHIREGEHWIEWHNSTTDYGVKCSYCDGYAIDEEGNFIKTPYCPWCGSKMEDA